MNRVRTKELTLRLSLCLPDWSNLEPTYYITYELDKHYLRFEYSFQIQQCSHWFSFALSSGIGAGWCSVQPCHRSSMNNREKFCPLFQQIQCLRQEKSPNRPSHKECQVPSTLCVDLSIRTITTVVEGLKENVPSLKFPNLLYFLACTKMSTRLGNDHHLHFPGHPLSKAMLFFFYQSYELTTFALGNCKLVDRLWRQDCFN